MKQGLILDDEARTFKPDGEVHVWGFQATSTNSIYTLDFSPESLSKLEYAIMFTLRFEED
ncbi:hypothetical protein [Paenibacillus sp. NEAU-GSW1]|uniref:hypothetical protein n=1 Tax=Paenibacillus sp. NEAU-GSW1 TaxID=2682486 RepID=UPI0012E159B3|nr:hypothetical protein [Paenibacillus sp. NEAU-GSW1]MUT65636.1 hypothetical protein [Paenibacillus sp. NEAU-GSW1]